MIVHEAVELKTGVKSHCHGNLFGRKSLAAAYFPCSPGVWVNCEHNNVIMHLRNRGGVIWWCALYVLCSFTREGGVTLHAELPALLTECSLCTVWVFTQQIQEGVPKCTLFSYLCSSVTEKANQWSKGQAQGVIDKFVGEGGKTLQMIMQTVDGNKIVSPFAQLSAL